MIKKNRFALILISLLLITWFTPSVFRDNIASAVIVTPGLTTHSATGVGTTNATLNGEITNTGNDTISSYGFQYGHTISYTDGYVLSTNLSREFLKLDTDYQRNTGYGLWGDGTYIYYTDYSAGNNTACIYAYTFNGTTLTLLDTQYDARANQEYKYLWGDGSYIYVASNDGGLNAYSFDGISFTLNATVDNGSAYWDVCGDGDYIYAACKGDGIRAYSFDGVTDTFTLLQTKDDGGDYYGVKCDGTYIYVSCGASGVRAYTFDGANFVLIDTQDDGGNYMDVWDDGTYIHTARGNSGISSYSFAGANFVLIDTDYVGVGYNWRVVGDGYYIYIANYQCSNPGEPNVIAYSFDGATLTQEGNYSDLNLYYMDVYTDNAFIYTVSFTTGLIAYSFGTGLFSLNLTGLTPGSVYHYRSFANNSGFTGYGGDQIFYTGFPSGAYININVDVYNESNGSQAIPFNIIIKNHNGDQVYSLLDQHNTCHIITTAILGNQTILIKVWYDEYRERIVYVSLGTSLTENYTFYLPRESLNPGADPGGASGFYPNSTVTATNYNLRVVYTIKSDYQEFDRPIKDAWINVTRFINSTGKYEMMSVLLTDTNGYANLFLLPSVLYLFNISTTDGRFVTLVIDWNPPPTHPYQLPELKIFRLELIDYEFQPGEYDYLMENITWSFSPDNTQYTGAIPFSFHIVSSDGQLQWYRMTVEFYNVSNKTWVMFYNGNASTSTGGYLNYTTPNITGQYRVECFFKKTGYSEYELFQMGSLHYAIIFLKAWLKQIPDFVWYLVIIVIMIMVMGFCYVRLGTGIITGYIGLGIMAFGLVMKPGMVINGFSVWGIFATTFILYTMALFLWSRI